MLEPDKLYVHYGCGPGSSNAPETWINFDASPTLRISKLPILGKLLTRGRVDFASNVRYGDIVTGLAILPGSCAAIYASHVLEHLSLNDFRLALKNTYDLLAVQGVFRFIVPDLQILAKKYLESNDLRASEDFMRSAMLGTEFRKRGFTGLLEHWLGNSKHLWMWDYKSLKLELDIVGFTSIRRYEFGDLSDLKFKDVEQQGRFIDAIAVECRKLA